MVRDQEKPKGPRRPADRPETKCGSESHSGPSANGQFTKTSPDEVYGDTEIPRRGRALDKMKSDWR
jgi:hypothetical protein